MSGKGRVATPARAGPTALASPKRLQCPPAVARVSPDGDSTASAVSGDELLLEWVQLPTNNSPAFFSPRCAHAMTVLSDPAPGPAAAFPTSVLVTGGCDESQYFPAEEV